MSIPLPNVSVTGGEAKSGVEGDTRSGGVWSGGGKTRVNIFAPDAGAIGVSSDAGGGGQASRWLPWVLAGAVVVLSVLAWRFR